MVAPVKNRPAAAAAMAVLGLLVAVTSAGEDHSSNPPVDTSVGVTNNCAEDSEAALSDLFPGDKFSDLLPKKQYEKERDSCTAWAEEMQNRLDEQGGPDSLAKAYNNDKPATKILLDHTTSETAWPKNRNLRNMSWKAKEAGEPTCNPTTNCDGKLCLVLSCKDHCLPNEDAEPEIDWAAVDMMNGKVGPGIIVEFLVLAYCFIGLAIVCDDHLCPALETLCNRWKIQEDVAGATFMALGSAAPEIVINLIAVVRAISSEDPEAIQLGVSAVMGSGMVSFLLATGVCAFYAPDKLILKRRPLLRDVGSYAIMVICLVIFFADGTIHLGEALTLVILYVVYIFVVAFGRSIRNWWRVNMQNKSFKKKVSFVQRNNGLDDDSDDELLGDDGSDRIQSSMQMQVMENVLMEEPGREDKNGGGGDGDGDGDGGDDEEEEEEEMSCWLATVSWPLRMAFEWTCPDAEEGHKYEAWYPLTSFVAFGWIALFSFLLSTIISRWSALMGIPTIILGMTLVAAGGEVPDTIQSISVAKRGYGGLAVANCLGSKVANVGLGLGVTWTLSSALGHDVKVCNAKQLQNVAIFHTAAIVLFFVLTLCEAWAFRMKKATLTRFKGGILLAAYPIILAGYIMYHYMH